MPADQHRSTLCDDISCDGELDRRASGPGRHRTSRSCRRRAITRRRRFASPTPTTGAVRDVLEETVPTQYESGNGMANWHVLPATNEVIWYSERDDWGQLYLYDLDDRQARRTRSRPATATSRSSCASTRRRARSGIGASARRRARIRTSATSTGSGIDGKDIALAHARQRRPRRSRSRRRASTSSTRTRSPTSRRSTRAARRERHADRDRSRRPTSRKLLATGWKPPMPIKMKARDGKTDLYGLMFAPTNSRSDEEVSDHQQHLSGTADRQRRQRAASRRRAATSRRSPSSASSSSSIDGMGTPRRSKSFHDAYYGSMGAQHAPRSDRRHEGARAALPVDRHRQGGDLGPLGRRLHHRRRDVPLSATSSRSASPSRAITTTAQYEDDWGERYQGLLAKNPDGTDNYDAEANQTLREEPEGPPAARARHDGQQRAAVQHAARRRRADQGEQGLRSAHAPEPARTATAAMSNYMMRRRWDYFVKYLLGAEPPKEYEIGAPRQLDPMKSFNEQITRVARDDDGCIPLVASAQIPAAEFAARRDSLAARIGDGVVVAFGGRTPVTDFGPFHQLPAFHYLTNFDEPDAAFVMVVHGGKGATTLFLTPIAPRTAFYYGWRPDSRASFATCTWARGRSRRSQGRRFARAVGAAVLHADDFEDADFARADSLTRGRLFVRDARRAASRTRGQGRARRSSMQLRAKKSPAEIALLKKAAEISSEGHRAAMTARRAAARVRAPGRARVRLHATRRRASGVRLDRRRRRERHAAALHDATAATRSRATSSSSTRRPSTRATRPTSRARFR